MDTADDIHTTARAFFLVRIANRAVPEEVVGGKLDGLRYFSIEVGGVRYWLTEAGLFRTPGQKGP